MRAHQAVRIVKTGTNAWCTSARLHDDVTHLCYFGCAAKDDMKHYVVCPHLYAVLRYLCEGMPRHTHARPAHESISAKPLQCLGLINTNPTILKVVACSFSGYHAIRFNYGGLFSAGGSQRLRTVIPDILHSTILRSFAESFSAEAHELALSSRAFDLDASENFFALGEFPLEAVADLAALL